jgi:hypothetical protein
MTHTTTLGELITTLYDEFLAVYGDEELASVAVAATINDLLLDASTASRSDPAAEAA